VFATAAGLALVSLPVAIAELRRAQGPRGVDAFAPCATISWQRRYDAAMLQQIELRNFKSFVHERATLSGFTLLVGANGTGKSNFLDALRLLHGLALGWSLWDVVSGKDEGSTRVWNGIRGRSRELVRLGAQVSEIGSDWMVLGDAYRHRLTTDGANILGESVGNLFEARRNAGARALEVEWLPGSLVQAPTKESYPDGAERSPVASGRCAFLSAFRATLAGIQFVAPDVDAMRDYVDRPLASARVSPGPGCKNLSAVLWQACRDARVRQEIVDWLDEFSGSEVKDVDFEETQSGQVLLRILDRNGQRISARSMSDGTLRFLGLLAHLRSLTAGSALVLEDLEHGLHPDRARLLVEVIGGATAKPSIGSDSPMVVATTHSADVVDAALKIPHSTVLLFAHKAGTEGAVIRDIRSLPSFDEVSRRRDVSYLLNTGWLERAV
jgi:predicted ATPase